MALRRADPSASEPPGTLSPTTPAGSSLELEDEDAFFEDGAAPETHTDELGDAESGLPLGVEPWSGSEMPEGTASSHDLHAPVDDASADAGDDPTAPGVELLPDASELNYRRLYETRFRDLESGAREALARQATDSELFALTLDPLPSVIAALLDNPQFGLAHARSVAFHHYTDRGLEMLTRRAAFARDTHVQRRLLANPHTPDVVLDRVLRFKRLLEMYRFSIDRDLPERNRVRVRSRLRPQFMRAEPEDRAALIIKTEGRCLLGLSGCTFDARTTQLLCNHSFLSTLFIQNLARFPATPPVLIAKLLRSPTVQRQPPLRAMLARHPNAGGDAKRKG